MIQDFFGTTCLLALGPNVVMEIMQKAYIVINS